MKKIVLIVLLVFSALLFVGCDVEQLLTSKVDDKNNTSFIVTDNNEEKTNSNSKSTEIGDDDLKVDKTELSEDHLLLESKQAYLDLYIKRNRKDATIDDVWLFNYLGKYNDCIVGVFLDRKNCLFTEEVLTIQIDNLCFYYSYGYEILVYKGGAFYTLYEAYYTSKVLDIIDINYIYKVYNKIEDNNNTENIDTNDDEIKRIETLFTLEEAYKKKYISKNDLLDLHDNIENRVKFELDEDIEQKILNDYLINVKKNFADATDATIDDVSIYGYYGHYNNLYVVRLDNVFVRYPDVIEELDIDGVVFSYSGPVYMVWLEENNILTTPIDGTYYGKLCYTYPGLSSISVDMVFEISNTKLIIHDDKELKIEECEYDDHFFDNLVLAKSYSLDYRQMFEYPNKGWFALLDSSETKKGGYSILISKFNTIYIFKTVFDLENDTYYIHAIYKLINQVEQTNVINSLFVDKYYFGMLLYVQPNLLSTREDTSMTFQDGELVIGSNKYKLEEKTFDDHFIKIDDDNLNKMFSFPTKGLIARIDDASYYCIIEGNDGIVYCLECAAINSEFYECDTLCAYLLVKKIKIDDSFMYRTVDDKCDSQNIAEASKVNLIQVDMTFEEVVEILGKPIAALGSGAIWYEWSLNDGTSLQIQFTPKGWVDVTLYVLRIAIKE